MNIAIVAHDNKKELATQFCTAYKGILEKHDLFATGTTGKILRETTGLSVCCFLPGSQGGNQQISARIAYNQIDLVLFFCDPQVFENYENEVMVLIRQCDLMNVPMATNLATAEIMVRALDRGDLDWRDIVNPKE